MAVSGAFAPQGQLILVDNTARQVGSASGAPQSYRVRNLSASVQYFTWGNNSTITSQGAPSAGTPVSNTIGMLPNSIETFSISGSWMIASSAAGFEVTPGEGL